jgi:hypothetical protein
LLSVRASIFAINPFLDAGLAGLGSVLNQE